MRRYAPGFPPGGAPPPQGQQGWSQGPQGPYPPMQPAPGAPSAPPLVLEPGQAPPPFPTPGQVRRVQHVQGFIRVFWQIGARAPGGAAAGFPRPGRCGG